MRKLNNIFRNKEPIKFIVACSRADILKVVEQKLSVNGILPVVGMQGELSFVIDGRWGGQLAAKRILNLKDKILDRGEDAEVARAELTEAMLVVDKVLDRFVLRRHLQGFVILRHALTYIYLHGAIPTPLTKTIFSDVATIMELTPAQVERNLRYLFEKLSEDESILKLQFPLGVQQSTYFGKHHQNKVVRLLIEEDKPYSIRVCLTRLGTLTLKAKKEFATKQRALRKQQPQHNAKYDTRTIPDHGERAVAEASPSYTAQQPNEDKNTAVPAFVEAPPVQHRSELDADYQMSESTSAPA